MALADEPERDIGEIFRQGTPIDEAMNRAVREAVRLHKLMGQPLVAWRDGKIVYLSAEEVEAEMAREAQP